MWSIVFIDHHPTDSKLIICEIELEELWIIVR